MKLSTDQTFQTLDFVESRWRSFGTSLAFHGALLLVLLAMPVVFTNAIQPTYRTVLIAAPASERQVLEVTYWTTSAPRVRHDARGAIAPEVRLPESPKIVSELIVVPERPFTAKKETLPIDLAEPEVALPAIEAREASPAKLTANIPVREVQTGGFGDPNGIPGKGQRDKPTNIVSLGSFDLPVGTGAGSGAGGARGQRTTVVAADFGNGGAVLSTSRTARRGNDEDTPQRIPLKASFGDSKAAPPKARPAASKGSNTGPEKAQVEVLFKPRPEYTDEARKMKVEGEVLLRVLFPAAGEVRVIDVVRGLGHGLDENAIRAAQQIRFKPAQQDGQAVDFTALVRIAFQLAY